MSLDAITVKLNDGNDASIPPCALLIGCLRNFMIARCGYKETKEYSGEHPFYNHGVKSCDKIAHSYNSQDIATRGVRKFDRRINYSYIFTQSRKDVSCS